MKRDAVGGLHRVACGLSAVMNGGSVERRNVLDEPRDTVGGDRLWFVGEVVAALIGSDDTEAGIRERSDLAAT